MEWREWLKRNHLALSEIWLVYYKKGSGKPRIAYRDAVEEAICFGWIDGKIRRVNEDYYVQRFTPRRKGSRWSRHNIEIAGKLAVSGMMAPAGMNLYREALADPRLVYDNRAEPDPGIPDDLLAALKENPSALDNFIGFPPAARRTYIYWLDTAKKKETRAKRIARIAGYAEKNIKPGML